MVVFIMVDSSMVKIFVAPDSVVCGMVEELLNDAGYEILVRSDNFLGIGGYSLHSEIYCKEDKKEEISKLLMETGFIKG